MAAVVKHFQVTNVTVAEAVEKLLLLTTGDKHGVPVEFHPESYPAKEGDRYRVSFDLSEVHAVEVLRYISERGDLSIAWKPGV